MSLHDEIFEQAQVISRLLSDQTAEINRIAQEINQSKPCYVLLAARGTSDNAGRYANYLWSSLNGIPVALATPSLFTFYNKPPVLENTLVVGISQSGQSPDIVSVLEEGQRQGCKTLVITNAPSSPLANAANWIIDIQAGEEKAVAATKTYTGELMAIAMLSIFMLRDENLKKHLAHVPRWIEQVLKLDDPVGRIAERYRYMEHCVVLGRGYNYATAFEWSLKMKELCYVVAEPYSSADFRHGPVAMIDPGFPVMSIATSGMVYQDMLEILKRLRESHRAEVLTISDQQEALDLAQSSIPIPENIPEWLSPLVAIIPGQLFAYHLARVKGNDPNKPRGIHKITETF